MHLLAHVSFVCPPMSEICIYNTCLFYSRISVEDLKSALSTKIEAEEIVGIRITKGRNVFVYLKDEDTLNVS